MQSSDFVVPKENVPVNKVLCEELCGTSFACLFVYRYA